MRSSITMQTMAASMISIWMPKIAACGSTALLKKKQIREVSSNTT